MAAATPMSDTELEQVRKDHAAGKSLTATARDLGRSKSTVRQAGIRMGLSWSTGNERTAAASAVRQQSNRDRRQALVSRMYGRAEKIMDRLEADQFKVIGFTGGEMGGRAVTTVVDADAIPGNEERALFGMAINALAAAAKLEAVDAADNGAADAKGILGNLSDALQAAYGQLAHTGNTATTEAIERELAGTEGAD